MKNEARHNNIYKCLHIYLVTLFGLVQVPFPASHYCRIERIKSYNIYIYMDLNLPSNIWIKNVSCLCGSIDRSIPRVPHPPQKETRKPDTPTCRSATSSSTPSVHSYRFDRHQSLIYISSSSSHSDQHTHTHTPSLSINVNGRSSRHGRSLPIAHTENSMSSH